MPKYCLFGEGNGTLLLYSCLENPMDGGAWWATVHGVSKSWTQLSNFTFPFHFHALEKEMATHSRVLAWRIPGTGEPGGLPSVGSHRVGHDWSDLAAAAAFALGEFFQSEDLCLFGLISFTNFPYLLRFLFGTPFRWWLEFKWSLPSTSLYLTFICSISGRSSAIWENSRLCLQVTASIFFSSVLFFNPFLYFRMNCLVPRSCSFFCGSSSLWDPSLWRFYGVILFVLVALYPQELVLVVDEFGVPLSMCSVQFSRSVVSDSLWPHESQHARPPCPSPTPGVPSNSCPSSQWCHPAISSSLVPFSSYPQSLPASESFPMSQLFSMCKSCKCKGVTLGCVLTCLCIWNFSLACLWGNGWVRSLTALLAAPDSSVWGVVFDFLLSVGANLGLPAPWESSTPTLCSCGQVTAWHCGEGAPACLFQGPICHLHI